MKLTESQKAKVIEYAKKLVGSKKLNESEDLSAEEVFNSIDWNIVGAEILKKFKIKTKLEFKLKSGQRSAYVEMISDNIISQCGIFKYAISKCQLAFFNNSLNRDPTHENKFWATIQLNYPGNGMNIGNIWISQNNDITIQLDTPRNST